MQKVKFLKGLPGSGKSTWSKEFCEKNTHWVRVNRDDLRRMSGKYWLPKQERLISRWERDCIISALDDGRSVIVDATNLNEKHVNFIKQVISAEYGAEVKFETKFFDVPLAECIKRDTARPNSVGEKVIRDMYEKYLKTPIEKIVQDPGLPRVIICDLDGTLALHVSRNAYEFMKCYSDEVNKPVAKIIDQFMYNPYLSKIIYMSGREDQSYAMTVEWLKERNLWKEGFCELHMRKTKDNRKDSVVKKELFDIHIKDKYYIDFILDDRNQVVSMWRELGLTCLQVAEGDF